MHDPLVVAFEIHAPWPRRARWRERTDAKQLGRWGLVRRRRTNPANLGEPVYPWWRPAGWRCRVAGRSYGLRPIATIWHVEPGGRDSGEVCKHRGPDRVRWRWHVHHWRIQIFLAQKVHRFLFERCIECGHRYPWGYAPVSHQWDQPPAPRFRVSRRAYHHECSSLVQLRRAKGVDERLILHLFGQLLAELDTTEADLLDRLTDPHSREMAFGDAYRLTRLLGFERDDDYHLTKRQAT